MTVVLDLPPSLEEKLKKEAECQGLSVGDYALRILEAHPPFVAQKGKAAALLQSWIEADDLEEQSETGEYLIRALDSDRLSARKLFHPELKGVTW